MFRVFKAPKFQKQADKILDKKESDELKECIKELKKGRILGKPLTYNFLREKKIGSKRVYFLVYEEIKVILLISASNKKYQQATIDEIKIFLPEFKKHAYKFYSKTN